MGAGVARPGISSARSAWTVFYHQAKVIVVLEAVAAFESKGCQRGVIHHLLCPLVGLAVARGCPAAGLLEQVYQTFKGFLVGGDAVHLCGNVCWPICPHGFLAFVGVKATLLRRRGTRFRRIIPIAKSIIGAGGNWRGIDDRSRGAYIDVT